ncbi:MAG TPA: ATP-binding protein [Kofleriaceae bacterium]|nr:ATP-binding protein [Kofleriaceae bacterium]
MSMERPPITRFFIEGQPAEQVSRVIADLAALTAGSDLVADCAIIAVGDSTEWLPYFGRFDIRRPHDKSIGGQRQYPGVLFVREQLPVSELLSRLEPFLRAEAPLVMRDHAFVPPAPSTLGMWEGDKHGSFSDYCRYPCTRYATRLDERAKRLAREVRTPLVTSEPYPYVEDLATLVGRVANFRPFHGLADGRLGYLHMFVWHYVAHFTGAVPDDDGALTVGIEGSRLEDVQLVGQFVGQQGETTFRESAAAQVRVRPASPPDRATLVLVDRDHSLLDLVRVDLTGLIVRSGEEEEFLKAQIAAGENVFTEFKPYVSLAADTPKWQEVLCTCIGFANAMGGTVFLGIDNHGRPRFTSDDRKVIGKDAERRGETDEAARRPVLERAILAYATDLRDRVQSYVNRTLDMSLRIVWLDAMPVLLMIVQKGIAPPYMETRDNSVWFRANATTRLPNEAELRAIMTGNVDESVGRR